MVAPSDKLAWQVRNILSAIDLCLKNELITPSLILIYSTIDIMAWLDREVSHEDVQRDDFIHWVETYLLSGSELSCRAIDLYAARCSLLHSNTAESALTRKGDATRIFYAWGIAQKQNLEKLIDSVDASSAKAIHIEALFSSLQIGVAKFLLSIENDPRHATLVYERSAKCFIIIPPIEIEPEK